MYLFIKIMHTIIAGLLLGAGLSTMIMLFVTKSNEHKLKFEPLKHKIMYAFWRWFMPGIFLQIILALILLTIKTPVIKNAVTLPLFLFFLIAAVACIMALFCLKQATNRYWLIGFAVTAFASFAALGKMMYLMAIISP